MAQSKKKISRSKPKSGLLSRLMSVLLGQKSSKQRAKANAGPVRDAAHAPGHRRLNVRGLSQRGQGKVQAQNDSALNRMSPSDRIRREEMPIRRVIPGASIERKGQRR
jgi:hypothetical protein